MSTWVAVTSGLSTAFGNMVMGVRPLALLKTCHVCLHFSTSLCWALAAPLVVLLKPLLQATSSQTSLLQSAHVAERMLDQCSTLTTWSLSCLTAAAGGFTRWSDLASLSCKYRKSWLDKLYCQQQDGLGKGSLLCTTLGLVTQA